MCIIKDRYEKEVFFLLFDFDGVRIWHISFIFFPMNGIKARIIHAEWNNVNLVMIHSREISLLEQIRSNNDCIHGIHCSACNEIEYLV